MTQTLYMTLGLPGSGKSTRARKMVENDPRRMKRVNKDDLRDMIHNGVWSRKTEKDIVKTQDALVTLWLNAGYSVIVDNTNFGWEDHFCAIAADYGVEFKMLDFTEVPLEECVKRDLARSRSVGRDVIERMYNQYLKPEPEVYEFTPGLPMAVIFDVDGTLAHMVPGPDGSTRSPYDYTRVHEDSVDEVVAGLARTVQLTGNKVLIVSGRDDECEPQTVAWLRANHVPFDEIHMRKTGDTRKDTIVKREIFDTHLRDRFNVRFVVDDRQSVIQMWRAAGLKCFEAQPGHF